MNYFKIFTKYLQNIGKTSVKNLMYFCKIFNFLSIMALIAVIPMIEISFGFLYKTQDKCINSLMSLSEWLIIKGIVTLIAIICVSLTVLSDKQSFIYLIVSPISLILNLFVLIWLIIGCAVFFIDCLDLNEPTLNTFMYISLFSGYLSTLIMICYENKTIDRKKTPLFVV